MSVIYDLRAKPVGEFCLLKLLVCYFIASISLHLIRLASTLRLSESVNQLCVRVLRCGLGVFAFSRLWQICCTLPAIIDAF